MKFLNTIIIFCVLLCFQHTKSQNIERFERLSTKDGLSQNTVLSSFSDSQGFLWFGTMDGLNRYDGNRFTIYRKQSNNPHSLTSNRIVKIWEDANQFIWAKSHDGHYHYFDQSTDKFYTFPKSEEIKHNKNVRITCFYQLNEKEIWLGTDNSGAYRLILNKDGVYDYFHYDSHGNNAISNNKIRFIISDKDDNIWIGTKNGVNKVIKKNEAISFQHFLIDHSFTDAILLENKFWFGTSNNGIISYEIQSNNFVAEKTLKNNYPISLLATTKSDHIVIGTRKSGLFILNQKSKESFNYLENSTIKRIYEDKKGALWVITDQPGIARLDPNLKMQKFDLVPENWQPFVISERQTLFEDSEGNIWIGSHGGGLAFYNEEKSSLTFYRNNSGDASSISSNVIHSITQDKSGLVWVGAGVTSQGLNKIIPTNPLFRQIQPDKKIENSTDNIVKGMLQDSRNNIWAATKSGYVYIYSKSFEPIFEFDKEHNLRSNIPESNIYSILQDREGFIWLGSKSKGVAVSKQPLDTYSDYKDIKFNRYKHDPIDSTSLSNDLVYSIIQDSKDQIWIGTYGGGVNLVKNRTSSKLNCSRITTENSELSSNEVRALFQDQQDRFWIATTFGLNLMTGGDSHKFISFTYDRNDPSSISYNDVICIFEDSKNRLWFGTIGGGVNYFADVNDISKGFRNLETGNGLIGDAVFGISEDKLGSIWFSTQNGISKYNPSSELFENFDTNNGLICSTFNENASLSLDNGNILFGNIDGMLKIDPEKISTEKFIPPLAFTNFLLFNREIGINDENSPLTKNINYTNEIILDHDQSSFSVEYSALSFFDSKKNQYSYTLENFDKTWYDVNNESKATYTNVPPGEYIFKVKGSNWDGTWNTNPRELKITIKQPWWFTNIAYLGYLIASIALIIIARRAYINYASLQTNLKVEKRVNALKLEFFTNISHEIRTPLTLILGPLDDLKANSSLPASLRDPLKLMNRNGKRILRLVNQLMDFRKIQNQKMNLHIQKVEINEFVNDICQNFEQLAVQKNIHFVYPNLESNCELWIDKEKLDSVLFNILANAFKFTKNGKTILVSILQLEDEISISIKDEGKGISKDKLPLIFKRFNSFTVDEIDFSGTGIGLAYSYELVKLHNGSIEVESSIGVGSNFKILIPKGNSHFSDLDILSSDKTESYKYSHAKEYDLENIPAPLAEMHSNKSKKRQIAIVEDNMEVINYLESILNNTFETFHATNGVEGLKLIDKIHPDVIITDVMMPEMDGITMTKKIKENFSTSHIPVVMLTAKPHINDQIMGIESGAEAYVLKPFNASHLLTIINNLITQREKLAVKFNSNSISSDIIITNKDQEFLKKVVKTIETNCSNESFNVQVLIKNSNLGRTVFFNKIKSLTGHSPVEYIRKVRLNIALKHISENNSGVAEAAYLSGFNDVKYFSKCFKKEFGHSPSELKKKAKIKA